MKLAVLVSGRGSNLRALVDAIDAGRCAAEVAAVLSDKADTPALAFAAERGYATHCVPLSRGDDRAQWNARLLATLEGVDPELIVLAGFMRVLGPDIIARFERRIVNVHPALLPSFPGVDGPGQAIRAGVRISGCTVHLVDQGVDTGPILAQAAVPVAPDDDAASLHARIQRHEHRLLPEVIDCIARGLIRLEPPYVRDLSVDLGAALAAPRTERSG